MLIIDVSRKDLGGQWAEVQLACVVDPDRAVVGSKGVVEDIQELGVVVVEALAPFVERGGLSGALERVESKAWPLLGRDEVAGGVGVPPGSAYPDLT